MHISKNSTNYTIIENNFYSYILSNKFWNKEILLLSRNDCLNIMYQISLCLITFLIYTMHISNIIEILLEMDISPLY